MKTIYWVLIIAAILIGIYFFVNRNKTKEGSTIETCLKNKGAKFYGASWCGHCQNQKKMFSNPQLLPYIECSGPNNTLAKVCQDAGINSFPAWVFKDGSTVTGEQTIAQLKQKTGC